MEEDAPNVVTLSRTTHKALHDIENTNIKQGDMYDQWVGLVDGEFTVDRCAWKEYYDETA